jgi:hypothetical protein
MARYDLDPPSSVEHLAPSFDQPSFDQPLFRAKSSVPGKRRGSRVSFRTMLLNFAQNVVGASSTSIKTSRFVQMGLLVVLTMMYVATFGVGLYLFAFAVIRGLNADSVHDKLLNGLVFGGLSAGAFVAVFLVRPTAEIGRASISNLWTSLLANTYWSRVAFDLESINDPKERDRLVDQATTDALEQLGKLFSWLARFDRAYLKQLNEEGRAALERLAARHIEVTPPSSPSELATDQGQRLTGIKVTTTPTNEATAWSIADGDADGTLVQSEPGSFTYTRGSQASDDVTLHFALASDDSISADLHVGKPSDGGARRSIAITDPDPGIPVELVTGQGTDLGITIIVVPPDEEITASIADGDADGTLVQSEPGSFTYTRGSQASDDVTLHFALASDDSISADLHVGTLSA